MNSTKKSKIFWKNFKKRNQSIIVDLFYGQYKSTIKCPNCYNISTSFDPFLSLTLPIAQNIKISIEIYFVFFDIKKKPLKINLTITKKIKFSQLRKFLAYILKIEPYSFTIFQIDLSGLKKFIDSNHFYDEIEFPKKIFISQIDPLIYNNINNHTDKHIKFPMYTVEDFKNIFSGENSEIKISDENYAEFKKELKNILDNNLDLEVITYKTLGFYSNQKKDNIDINQLILNLLKKLNDKIFNIEISEQEKNKDILYFFLKNLFEKKNFYKNISTSSVLAVDTNDIQEIYNINNYSDNFLDCINIKHKIHLPQNIFLNSSTKENKNIFNSPVNKKLNQIQQRIYIDLPYININGDQENITEVQTLEIKNTTINYPSPSSTYKKLNDNIENNIIHGELNDVTKKFKFIKNKDISKKNLDKNFINEIFLDENFLGINEKIEIINRFNFLLRNDNLFEEVAYNCDENNFLNGNFIRIILNIYAETQSINSYCTDNSNNKKIINPPRVIFINKNWSLKKINEYIFESKQ